jgi:virginiamycin B lyase
MAHHALVGLLALAMFQGSAADTIVESTEHVEITEWRVPWPGTRPRDPAVGGANEIWFVGQQGDYVGLLRPETGEFERFDLPEGAGPHNVIVGSDGGAWYAGNRQGYIGRVDPETGEVTQFMMPDPEQVRDPHTLLLDESGDIWFTAQVSNYVGRLSPSRDGEVGLIEVPTERARPYGITMDSTGRPWFVEFGSNKIGVINPATMALSEYPLPNADARPRRIALTSDDAIWYVDYARGYLGRMDPATHEVTEWRAPGGSNSQPYGMTVDDMDRLWFFETNPDPNRLVGFDPDTESFFSVTDVGSGGGTVRHMVFDEATRQIWFGTDTDTIGRAQLR